MTSGFLCPFVSWCWSSCASSRLALDDAIRHKQLNISSRFSPRVAGENDFLQTVINKVIAAKEVNHKGQGRYCSFWAPRFASSHGGFDFWDQKLFGWFCVSFPHSSGLSLLFPLSHNFPLPSVDSACCSIVPLLDVFIFLWSGSRGGHQDDQGSEHLPGYSGERGLRESHYSI